MKIMKSSKQGPLRWIVIFLITTGCIMSTLYLSKYLKADETKMNQAAASQLESLMLPAMDETAPALVETASFGLG